MSQALAIRPRAGSSSARRTARALKILQAVVFLGVGGWCLLAPHMVEALSLRMVDIDMAQMLRDALRPRLQVAPERLAEASARAGELTGVCPVRSVEELLEEMQ